MYGQDLIGEFVKQVMEGSIVVSKNTEQMINARIAQIDKLISRQLNEIMHHPDFQKLEGSWRGLAYLVNQTETSDRLKIRVMNVSKKDLLKDMEKASEFDQSTLFKKIYEEEFGMFGGAAFGALIGDYEFGNHPQDLALLEKISQVAAAAHAPFVSAAAPHIFNLDSFTDLGDPRDLAKIFQSVEYRQVEVFPRFRGFPLRGARAAAYPDAAPLRPGQRAGGGLQLRGGCRRHGSRQVSLGECGLRPERTAHRRLRQVWLVCGHQGR